VTHALAIDIETLPDLDAEVLAIMRDKVEAPANYRDPAKILAYKAEQQEKLVDRAALSPLLGRIVAIGWAWCDELEAGGVSVDTAPTPQDERPLLRRFADMLLEEVTEDESFLWVTFNGRGFDLPFLAVRCAHHGVALPHRLPIGEQKYRRHRDIYEDCLKHFGGGLSAWGQRIAGKAAIGEGKDVGAMVAEGRWDDLVQHCSRDVEILVELYSRFSEVMT
jgi:predicted PolB exonuclease-like 3'-5' exonuclease